MFTTFLTAASGGTEGVAGAVPGGVPPDSTALLLLIFRRLLPTHVCKQHQQRQQTQNKALKKQKKLAIPFLSRSDNMLKCSSWDLSLQICKSCTDYAVNMTGWKSRPEQYRVEIQASPPWDPQLIHRRTPASIPKPQLPKNPETLVPPVLKLPSRFISLTPLCLISYRKTNIPAIHNSTLLIFLSNITKCLIWGTTCNMQ